MRKIIVLFSLLIAFSCEDKDEAEETSPLIGTWEGSNLGEYENANCSGAVDYTGWAFAVHGYITIVIREDGTGTMIMTFEDEKEQALLTWDDSKSQICIMGDCLTYKLDGDSFTVDQPEEAICEDDDGDETNHDTQSTCETAGNNWEEASCTQMKFTKK